jgi:hypothetical protein
MKGVRFERKIKTFQKGSLEDEHNEYHVYSNYEECDPVQLKEFLKNCEEDLSEHHFDTTIHFHNGTSKSWKPWLTKMENRKINQNQKIENKTDAILFGICMLVLLLGLGASYFLKKNKKDGG